MAGGCLGCLSLGSVDAAPPLECPSPPLDPAKRKGELHEVEVFGPSAETVAAVAAAASAATIIAGAVNSDVRHALNDVAGAAGCALLSLGKELPWVAPIAFLIGGVVQAAADVRALKGDAQTFARNVRSVERIMQEAGEQGTLAGAREACEALQEIMEEGLAHCHRLKTQYFITSLMLAGRDAMKFQDLSNSLQSELQLVCTCASVSVANIHFEKAEQGRKLKQKIAELGGAEKLAGNSSLKNHVRDFLSDSDQVVVASIDAAHLQSQKSQKHLCDTLGMQSEESNMHHKLMAKQVNKLTSMMEALLKLKAGLGDEVEAVDVKEIDLDCAHAPTEEDVAEKSAGMSSESVREALAKMPVTHSEADRLQVVRDVGLEGDNADDIIGDAELTALIKEAAEEFGVTDGYIGAQDSETHTNLVGCRRREDGSLEDDLVNGMRIPREMTMCQHTVATGAVLQANGRGTEDGSVKWENNKPIFGMAELVALAGTNKLFESTLGSLGHAMNAEVHDDELVDMGSSVKVKARNVRDFTACMGTEALHYTGVPIRVEGKTVATFCLLDRSRHRNDIDGSKVQIIADRAAEIFKRRAAAKKNAAATTSEAKPSPSPMDNQLAVQPAKRVSFDVASTTAAVANAAAARGEVMSLNADNFQAVTMDPSLDVVVLLVTPWCHSCGDAKVAWREAALRNAGKKAVFAMFDIDKEDPPTPMRSHADVWRTASVPVLVLSPRGEGAEPRKFGPCSSAELSAALRWMSSNGVAVDAPPAPPEPHLHPLSHEPSSHALVASRSPPAHLAGQAISQCLVSLPTQPSRPIMDTELLQIALAGFRQAVGSSSEIVAAWAAAAASGDSAKPAAAAFPSFLKRALEKESAACEEHVARAQAAGDRSCVATAVTIQQECHHRQAQLLCTLAGSISKNGCDTLGEHSAAIMKVSEAAADRHIAAALTNVRVAMGCSATGAAGGGASAVDGVGSPEPKQLAAADGVASMMI
mmetsp:Transcript_8534/g.21511  ORF Transcript_8534/g.21511 Transcript_8534/m.21511 type:complete len:985 (-) Transcript_8534:253-3207(-)|eukprot:CAMPEP_0197606758 /NCGR_PEP_ID=MMETSP1326-20131121/45719_1 /TAXON_ID=1155430 /ORGANISM="Genus nov. species nov., Strain RCC2288" /LENGTH=984 /DNA_ID=CAMNT_0043174725 /DNA_START=200 /DNA_END=3154 /DNA_ORIENTATION=-